MAQQTERLVLRDIKVEAFAYRRILDLIIEERAGFHGICRLEAAIPQALKPSEVLALGQGRKITLKTPQGGIVFCGMIVRAVQEEREGTCFLRVAAQTLSAKLDRQKKCRTFQSPEKTLKQVLSEVASKSGCKKPDITGGASAGEKIPQMLYQDFQTDWEFLHRLAESSGKLLFADGKTDVLRVGVGVIPFKGDKAQPILWERGRRIPAGHCERIQKNTLEKARTAYFIETDVASNDLRLGAGYSLSYDGKEQIVTRSRIVTEGSTLVNFLTLLPKEGCRAAAWEELRETNRGKYLSGKVLEAMGADKEKKGQDNCVKVHFDCDKSQNKKEARWIPYDNVVNNYVYSMPDEGDRVSVYFEENGTLLAIGSLRGTDSAAQSRLQDCKPENKSFLSEDQLLEFQPKELSLVAGKKGKDALLKETDEKGIFLQAKKNVLMESSGDLVLQAASGSTMSNQVKLAVPHGVAYGIYTATMGTPSSTMLNPMGGMLGESPSSLKSGGAASEKPQLSDLAKELDKKAEKGNDAKQTSSSGGASGSGKMTIKAGKTLLLKVGDSSIEVSKRNIKTRALFTVGYMPGVGMGNGSPSVIAPGRVNNRSASIQAEHGAKDRPRLKEGGRGTNDNKRISRAG